MKILYICRIFSGLELSIKSRRWKPTGVPTIYKILEYFDKSEHKLQLVLTDFGVGLKHKTVFNNNKMFYLNLKGFSSPISVITDSIIYKKFIFRILFKFFNFLKKTIIIINLFLKNKPDLIYIDRSNILVATILARFFKAKVILRIMGIYPSMWELEKKNTLRNIILKWCYKSKFKLVICTNDGTAGEMWMKKFLHKSVKRENLLNGVDNKKFIKKKKKKKIDIFFIGRLESIKGCIEFVEGISLLSEEDKKKINVTIVGTGSLKIQVLSMIKKKKLTNTVKHQNRVTHNLIKEIHKKCDIYVSLNKLGNLSNANLECFCSGICSIVIDTNPEMLSDLNMNRYFNNKTLIKIPYNAIQKELAKKISYLINNKEKINYFSRKIYIQAFKVIKTWDERIAFEKKLIERIK